MRIVAATACLFLACSLSACGSGGTVSSTPTPTPSPMPAQSNATLTNLQFTETFDGRGATNAFTLGANGAVSGQQAQVNGQVQVRYDASTSSYTITAGTLPDMTFSPADRDLANSTATITGYQKTSGARTDSLALLNPGPANALSLTYVSYGGWQTTTSNGNALNVSSLFFVYGVKTQQSDLPISGTASYQTIVDGLFAGAGGVYVLGGQSSFSANFGAGTVSFSMSPVGTHIDDGTSAAGSIKNFGTLNGSGTINAGAVSFGASAPSNGSYSTSLLGKFYGPGAAEMGATFLLNGADGQGSGAIVGKKN